MHIGNGAGKLPPWVHRRRFAALAFSPTGKPGEARRWAVDYGDNLPR